MPDLQILATSRTPLRLSAERVLPLEPLSIEDATTLFVELAAARGVLLQEDALASVHEICRRLDGLPLAIELVAARLAVLPPAEILRALGEGLALEMEGPVDLPERQRTLRAAIDWSYQRLSPSQRALHGALAVFADSATLDDARAVAEAGPDVPRRTSKRSSDGASFAATRLTARSVCRCSRPCASTRSSSFATEGRLEELRQRHAERFLDLALEAEDELDSSEQPSGSCVSRRDFDNLDAALDWLLSSGAVGGCSAGHLRSRAVLAWPRARGGGPPAARARASSCRRKRPPTFAPTLSGPRHALRPGRATGTPRCRCSRRRSSSSVRRTAAESSSSRSPSSDPSRSAATTRERAAALCDEALTIAVSSATRVRPRGVSTILADVARTRGDHAAGARDMRRRRSHFGASSATRS